MKRVQLLNALSGVAQVSVNIVLLMVTIPVFIGTLGIAAYGIYAVISVVGSLGVFTNLGFNASLIKYLAEQKDKDKSNYDIAVVFVTMSGSALVVGALALVFRDFVLLRLFNLAPELVTPSVHWLYVASVGASLVQVMGQVPGGILDSLQKVYVTNVIQLAVGVATKALILISLLIAPSLEVIGWITLATTAAGMAAMTWTALTTWGRVSCPALSRKYIPVLRKHLSYGKGVYGSVLMGFFYEPMTKALISHFIGVVEVGFFDVALRVKTLAWSIFERMLYPVMPLFASKTKDAEIRGLIEELQRKLAAMIVPLIIGTVFLSQPLVILWLGEPLPEVVTGIAFIVPCYLAALMFVPLYHFLVVRGHPQKTMVLQSVNVAVNAVLFAVLVPWFGYYGSLWAFCAAVLTSTVLCGWYQWSLLRLRLLPSAEYRRRILKLAAVLILMNLLAAVMVSGEVERIVLLAVVNSAGTLLVFRMLGIFTTDDVSRYLAGHRRFGAAFTRLLIREGK